MYIALVFMTLSAGCQCAQWLSGPEDGATVYVCDGQDLTLPWNIMPDTGEEIVDIMWFLEGHSYQMIAEYTAGTFLPIPSYAERLRNLTNGGIVLSHVTQGDEGNYLVAINIRVAGSTSTHVSERRTAVLHVATVSTARTDATLGVRQQPIAVYNKQTGQYHVELSCSSSGNPPSVIWMTPSHQTLQRFDKNGDTFSLMLPNPVSGGNYTCRVPPDSPPASCLPRDDPSLEGATIFVDKMEARTTLLEARLTALQVDNREKKTQITGLKADKGKLEVGLWAVQAENSELKTRIARLTAVKSVQNNSLADLQVTNVQKSETIDILRQDVQSVKDVYTKRVIFHARLASHLKLSKQPIIPTIVHVNEGNAYNATTGEFTVPYSGYYYFTATAGGGSYKAFMGAIIYARLCLMVDGSYVSLIFTVSVNYHEMGTCSYAGRLNKGQKVTLMAMDKEYYRAYLTSFSGFLVYPD